MEITKDQINKIEQYVSSKLDSLNWQHTQGVRQIARKLAGLGKADKEIVDMAVLFHDLGKIKIPGVGHAEASAHLARGYLEKENFNQQFIEEVVYCVKAHELPWSNQANLMRTIESKVLFDADVIQQLSEFGIFKQVLIHSNVFNKSFMDGVVFCRDNLFKSYNLIITKNGRKMADRGYKFIKDFFQNLL